MPAVPLDPVPYQIVRASLGGQSCRIAVYERKRFVQQPDPDAQYRDFLNHPVTVNGRPLVSSVPSVIARRPALYFDLSVNEVPVVIGVLCVRAKGLVRSAYLGFVGEMAFFDRNDSADPQTAGLGSRWFLYYLPPA